MGRSWLENTATWRVIDWLSVIVDFPWQVTATDDKHVRDLDEAIAYVDARSSDELATALDPSNGRALVGSVARPHGEDLDVVMAKLLFLPPLATQKLRDSTITALVDARGRDDGWRFPRYFPSKQLVAAWDSRAPAATITRGLARGGAVAVDELLRASGERQLDGVARLIEVMCGALKHGPNDDALDYGLDKTLCGLVPMSIARDADVDDRARVAFVQRVWRTLRPWREPLARLVLELPTACPTVASASGAIDALAGEADHWTIKRVLYELCAIARRPNDMAKYAASPQARKLLRLHRRGEDVDEHVEIARAYEDCGRIDEAIAWLDRGKPNAKRLETLDRLQAKSGRPRVAKPADALETLEDALRVGVLDPAHLKAVTDPEKLAGLISRHQLADAIACAVAYRVVELAIAPKTIWLDADLARSVTLAAVRTTIDRAKDDVERAELRTKLRKKTKRVIDKGGYFERELALAIEDELATPRPPR